MIYRGADWTPLGEALIQNGVEVLDVAVFGGDLYAAVSPLYLQAKALKSLVRWDGQEWVEVPGTPLASVACLKTFADGLCNSSTICSKVSHSRRERSGCWESVCI